MKVESRKSKAVGHTQKSWQYCQSAGIKATSLLTGTEQEQQNRYNIKSTTINGIISSVQEELTRKYLESIDAKAMIIKTLWEKFLQGDKSVLDEILLHAHSLKGSGATFGFPEISDAGRELEQAHDNELLDRVNNLLNILGRVTARKMPSAANEVESPPKAVEFSRQALIIERNPVNARAMADCISRLDGIENCELVETGAQAREKYRSTRYSLIVLDLVLPDQDGRELLREIKQSDDFNCPVLVISGVPSDSIYMECIKIGADEYLAKPFDTDKLYFEAQQVLQRNRLQVVGADAEKISAISTSGKVEAQANMSLKGVSILVAEDDEIQAIFITGKLAEHGADVTHAENGQLALDALEKNSYSAVILDGKMPVMDGFETLQSIRNNSRLKGLPVIMVTAMGSEENIVKGYELGANDYILKPFSEEQLVNRIKSLLVMAA